jgi:hypothetical protein
MKINSFAIPIAFSFLSACVSIPKETVTLSQTLGNDLQVLHVSHRNCLEIYYKNIKGSINSFIDDVYAPYIIHYTLNKELDNYKKGGPSLYKVIDIAGQKGGKKESDDALNKVFDFLAAARDQIEKKRNEYLFPILKQENELIFSVDQAYENAINANSTITGFLLSVRKAKETYKDDISKTRLPVEDTITTDNLVKLSEWLDQAVQEGKKIDIRSDGAYKQIDVLSKRIKQLTEQN